jgi:hypothetical protein
MPGPRYPNQQLKSVSLEAYFPGQLSVITGLPGVQTKFRASYLSCSCPTSNMVKLRRCVLISFETCSA